MMPPMFLIKFVAGLVGDRFAKAGAWAILAALVLAALSIAKCRYDADLIADHDARVTQRSRAIDAKAKDAAAEQRARDTITIDKAEKERKDAIQSVPAGRPDDARTRLNCQRLRQGGFRTADFPECRGFDR